MQLLQNNYIDMTSKDRTKNFILAILHELRVLTSEQILKLCNLEFKIGDRAIRKQLLTLQTENYIGKNEGTNHITTPYYFLTKQGHNFFGGNYTFPKVPEYNLAHHLMLTDCLIISLTLAKNYPSFIVAQSERRQVYEVKDGTNTRGKKYNVSDYLFRFVNSDKKEINWHFEIELSLKSRQRYAKNVIPKYFNMLMKEPSTHVFYVTPSNYILNELTDLKNHFIIKNELLDMSRLHVISLQQFESELDEVLKTDPYIN